MSFETMEIAVLLRPRFPSVARSPTTYATSGDHSVHGESAVTPTPVGVGPRGRAGTEAHELSPDSAWAAANAACDLRRCLPVVYVETSQRARVEEDAMRVDRPL